jgi:RimJ/RimL family protein N-acetyltransferase
MPYAPRLESNSLYLRGLDHEDVTETYCEWLNHPLVNRYLETRYKIQTIDDINNFITNKNQSIDERLFGIFIKEQNKHIGNIKLGPVQNPHKLAEISLFIGDTSEWGKGYATEAISIVTDYAFNELHMNKLIASMYAEIQASTRAFISAGWEEEARLKEHYLHDGKTMDLIIVGITARRFFNKS